MKLLMICLSMCLLIGCGATKVNYTVFLKEESSIYQNLKGEECSESGYQLDQNGTRLITFYSNCDVHKYHVLKDFEIKQWKAPKQ